MSDLVIVEPNNSIAGALIKGYLNEKGFDTEIISVPYRGPEDYFRDGKTDLAYKIFREIKKAQPQVVGISTIYFPKKFLEDLKRELEAPLLLGGCDTEARVKHVAPADLPHDFVIVGTPEGLPYLLKAIGEGREKDLNSIKHIPGLVYKEGSEIKLINPPKWNKSFYLEVEPDVEGRRIEPDGSVTEANMDTIPVPYILGCHYGKCKFCVEPMVDMPTIKFTPEEAADVFYKFYSNTDAEMVSVISQTVHGLDALCREILSRGDVNVRVMSRVNDLLAHYQDFLQAIDMLGEHDRVLILGCVGMESFDDGTLRWLGKGTTGEMNLKAVEKIRETYDQRNDRFIYQQPISQHGLIIFTPFSTRESVYREFRTLKKHELWDFFSPSVLVNKLMLYPHSPLMDDVVKLSQAGTVEILGQYEWGGVAWKYVDDVLEKLGRELCVVVEEYERNLDELKSIGEVVGYSFEVSERIINGVNRIFGRVINIHYS